MKLRLGFGVALVAVLFGLWLLSSKAVLRYRVQSLAGLRHRMDLRARIGNRRCGDRAA